MTVRLPLAIVAFTLTVFGALGLIQTGGVDAVIGPSLAATVATIVVLVGVGRGIPDTDRTTQRTPRA